MDIIFKKMQAYHWPEICQIYKEGIATKMATFETDPGSWEEWDAGHMKSPRLVAFSDHHILGWAALSAVSNRCVYEGVAEVSIYIRSSEQGKGIGTQLLQELIRQSESEGIWTLQSGIFSENQSSIKLHEKCGFRIVGIREKLGKMDGIWRDVTLLERRSKSVGV